MKWGVCFSLMLTASCYDPKSIEFISMGSVAAASLVLSCILCCLVTLQAIVICGCMIWRRRQQVHSQSTMKELSTEHEPLNDIEGFKRVFWRVETLNSMLDDPLKEVELEKSWINFAKEIELERFLIEAWWKIH